jgi:hypothetical protein
MNNAFSSESDLFEHIHNVVDDISKNGVTEEEWFDFEQLLMENDDAFRMYFEYMGDSSLLQNIMDATVEDSSFIDQHEEQRSVFVSSAFGCFSDATYGTIGFFSQEVPFGFLIATLLTGLLLLGMWLTPVSRPAMQQIAGSSQPAESKTPAIEQKMLEIEYVGRIVDTVDCKFSIHGAETENHKSEIKNQESLVALGDRLILDSGLMEIVYDTGARVVLQGPCAYTVESTSGGLLAVGKLTARLEKKAASNFQPPASFFVRTPTAVVTDLGTEFDVEVGSDKTTMVHVIQGVVEAQRDKRTGGTLFRERITAGQSIYVASLSDLPLHIDLSEHPAPLQHHVGGRPVRIVLSPELKASLKRVRDARNAQTVIEPIGLVATAYHHVLDKNGRLLAENNRDLAFRVVTDGFFGRGLGGEEPRSSFDTQLVASGGWPVDSEKKKVDNGQEAVDSEKPQAASNQKSEIRNHKSPNLPVFKSPQSAFVGLRYSQPTRFDRIKIYLARQTEIGGSWVEMPRMFILKNPVDTNQTPPEDDPANWRELPRQLFCGDFGSPATPAPGAVIELMLTSVPAKERTGYGWAIGGVRGSGTAGYVSVTELRAYRAAAEESESNATIEKRNIVDKKQTARTTEPRTEGG